MGERGGVECVAGGTVRGLSWVCVVARACVLSWVEMLVTHCAPTTHYEYITYDTEYDQYYVPRYRIRYVLYVLR